MDIKNIVVKEYLESLTEKDELNRIFPILLEAMNFQILSKPTEYVGLKEYGKDIVAICNDEKGIQTRYYFELKGGSDRDITEKNFGADDGIFNSLTEATIQPFISSHPNFEELPLKIIIVHNGTIKGNVQPVLEGLLKKLTALAPTVKYERWDISKLTLLFSKYLFSPYLLVGKENIRLFNRVLINLDSYEGVSPDFTELIQSVLNKDKWETKRKLPRSWKLVFETMKLLSFIIYTEAKAYNNLDIAKRYLSQLVLQYWHWILKNKLESQRKVKDYFKQVLDFYFEVLSEYFDRILPIIMRKDGVYSEDAGRYEQVGYTMRAFDVLQFLLLYFKMKKHYRPSEDPIVLRNELLLFIKANSVTSRALLDIHSIPILDTLLFLYDGADDAIATVYIENIFIRLRWSKTSYDRLPDANNNVENVLRLILTGQKSVYYSDTTSPLLTMLLEFTAILNNEQLYNSLRDFIIKHKIDLGFFIPHHGKQSLSRDLIDDKENDLEEQLFSKSFDDGYQSSLRLLERKMDSPMEEVPLSFADYKQIIVGWVNEFEYDYRTDSAGFPFLRDLAHIYYKTPYFPDRWRSRLKH